MVIRLTISCAVGIALFTGLAQAQSAEAVLAGQGVNPQLTIAVSDEVSGNVDAAEAFCRAADGASQQVQVYVGAGLADAHRNLLLVNDTESAASVKATVCTCETSPGQILSSFANGIGELERDVCASAWRGTAGLAAPTLFQINTRGGGDGVSRN